jgi:hypothetical protein
MATSQANTAAQAAAKLPVSGPQYTPEQQAYVNYWYQRALQQQQTMDANAQQKYADNPELLAKFRLQEQANLDRTRNNVNKQVGSLPAGTGYGALLAKQHGQTMNPTTPVQKRTGDNSFVPNMGGWSEAGGVWADNTDATAQQAAQKVAVANLIKKYSQ